MISRFFGCRETFHSISHFAPSGRFPLHSAHSFNKELFSLKRVDEYTCYLFTVHCRYGANQRRRLRESETAETLQERSDEAAWRSPAASAAGLRNIGDILKIFFYTFLKKLKSVKSNDFTLFPVQLILSRPV